ncbi:hypothetical protein AMEX_G24712 [Astyanax mexicanus]|uniref:Immunoglobulin domain-containing protein n=1 Tax=Astyanax mexicanus TaxID=7994 RepID=A0A8T2KVX3_ASTMX|nr:hypothetical protein AMEX_G24712 [Astyanax mexicanus]
MKILLIFTFFLISGPAACFDVIGYSRGSIIIYCYNKLSGNDGYFCKESTNQCVFLESAQRQNSWDHGGRVSLTDFSGHLRVYYRDLSLEDAGTYRCGETGVWNHTVNLRVKTDPCCLGPKTVIGYLGETVTINCNYPEEFQTKNKTFNKQVGPYLSPMISTTDSQKGRFSISDNRRSRFISVRISDVREDDGGVYYCGVWIDGIEVSYLPLYTEIHLQVSASSPSIIIIIILSICVALLLIGGLTLIFFIVILKKRQGIVHLDTQTHTQMPTNQISLTRDQLYLKNLPIYQSFRPNINQSDSVYQSLKPDINQSDSVYQSLGSKTNQSNSVYQTLSPNTSQSDSFYLSLNPHMNP